MSQKWCSFLYPSHWPFVFAMYLVQCLLVEVLSFYAYTSNKYARKPLYALGLAVLQNLFLMSILMLLVPALLEPWIILFERVY